MFWKAKQGITPSTAQSGHGGAEWDPQANTGHVKSAEEKRFLRKLDLCLLTFGCISQVIKYLDQQNINFAYTAGMKEDLHLYGNELNFFLTYFQVGYCIFLIPSQVMISRFPPAIWLSSLEFLWGGLTMCLAATHTSKQVYAIRFFIGAAESSAYPGTVSLLMTWYSPTEMAKRIGFYHSCQAVGALLSGAIQSGVYSGLDGAAGLAGWRWTFIINGIMTIFIAACGFFMIPDFPDRTNPRAFWLKPYDKEIATARLDRWQRKSPKGINVPTFKRLVKSPMTYHFIFLYAAMLIGGYGCNYMNLFLKSLKNSDGSPVWKTSQLSAVPIGGYAIQIASNWAFSWSSDIFRTRWLILLIICAIGFPPTLILTIWNVPTAAKYYAYFSLFATISGGPIVWSWQSDMLPRDAELRTLMIGVSIALYYAINSWANVLVYPASEAPHYARGWPAAFALFVSSALVIVSLHIYDIKVVRPRNYREAVAEQEALGAQEVDHKQAETPVIEHGTQVENADRFKGGEGVVNVRSAA